MPRHRARFDLAIEAVNVGDRYTAIDPAGRYLFSIRAPAVEVWLIVTDRSADAFMFDEFAKNRSGNVQCIARDDCLPVSVFMKMIGREFIASHQR